jgi:hypothetical protein
VGVGSTSISRLVLNLRNCCTKHSEQMRDGDADFSHLRGVEFTTPHRQPPHRSSTSTSFGNQHGRPRRDTPQKVIIIEQHSEIVAHTGGGMGDCTYPGLERFCLPGSPQESHAGSGVDDDIMELRDFCPSENGLGARHAQAMTPP